MWGGNVAATRRSAVNAFERQLPYRANSRFKPNQASHAISGVLTAFRVDQSFSDPTATCGQGKLLGETEKLVVTPMAWPLDNIRAIRRVGTKYINALFTVLVAE